MSEAHVEIDPEIVEQLRASKKLIGPLEKVVLNAQGERVDGDHRKAADPDWPEETNDNLKTRKDCVLYKIAKNWHRTNKSENWKRAQIEELARMGDDVHTIVQETGLKERTVYYYYPADLKKPEPEQLAKGRVESQESVDSASPALNLESQETENPAEELMKKAKEATRNVDCHNCLKIGGFPLNTMKEIGGHLYCPKCAPSVHVAKKNEAKTERAWKETPEFRVAKMKPGISKMDEAMLVKLQNSAELRELGWKVEFQKAYYIMICRSDASLVREGEEVMLFWDGSEVHKHPEEDEAIRERAKEEQIGNGVRAEVFARAYKVHSVAEEQRLFDEMLVFLREMEKWKEPSSGQAEDA